MSNDRYMPRVSKPWPVCSVCGLAAPDVRGEPPKCPDARRCVRVGVDFAAHKQGALYPTPHHYGDEPPPPDFKGEKPPKK